MGEYGETAMLSAFTGASGSSASASPTTLRAPPTQSIHTQWIQDFMGIKNVSGDLNDFNVV
jgi:hypothetical protein